MRYEILITSDPYADQPDETYATTTDPDQAVLFAAEVIRNDLTAPSEFLVVRVREESE